MTRVRAAIMGALLTALVALPLLNGGLRVSMASAQEKKATQVKFAPIPSGEYRMDPAHSTIGFAIRHMEINWVEGRFKEFTGTINYDAADFTKSSVTFTAKVASIDTGVAPRDNHLRTADFFEVEKYPEMTFKSTRVERKGKNGGILHGELTLKGVTKQISFPFTVTGAIVDGRGNTRIGIAAQTKINRRDYGITWGKTMDNGGLDIGNEVTINLNLEAIKPAPKPAS